jgi:signal transduction histidine kinase/DNA-binding response OmpR family regulator
VRDTGVGVPDVELPRIFERFHRVEATRGRALEGTGIGLALVQELVRLHGGSVTVQSTFGRGSAFVVTVPFGTAHLPTNRIGVASTLASTALGARPYVEEALRWLPGKKGGEEGAAEPPPVLRRMAQSYRPGTEQDLPGAERPRVLLADDNADMREYVQRLLAMRYEVEGFPDGQAALEAARRRRPALLLADVMMPRLDGFTLLRELRADPQLRTIPVILLSARAGEESRVEGLEAGADDYLIKPFSARELLARVTSNMELARVRQEVEHERGARAAAEEAERRSAFLARAGALLSESLDHEETLARLSRLCVQSLADTCVLDLVEGTEIRRVASACADPAKEPILERMRERHAARWDSPHPASSCLRTGRPVLIPDFDDAALQAVCEDEEHRALARAMGTRSVLTVPLVARGQTLGALSLASTTPRRYGRADLELVQEVADRAAIAIDNARLYSEAQEAVRLRDEFLQVASHELRTPLTPLSMALQVLQRWERSEESTLPAPMGELLELATRQGTRLHRLVGDLLDVSRIQSLPLSLDLDQVELEAVVREVVRRFEPDLARAGCRLSIRSGAPVTGCWDGSRIDQVVANLLSNAAKFGAGKPIEISLGEASGTAQLSIRDQGLGIDPAQHGRIFGRFGRAVSPEHYGGLGFGLFISRRIVEAHGGTIKVESRPGAGATFTIELPCAGPREAAARPQEGKDAEAPTEMRARGG